MLNIAITGASGFIGKHLTNKIQTNKNFNIIQLSRVDVQNYYNLRNKKQPHIDILIHLAQPNNRLNITEKEIKLSIELINRIIKQKYETVVYVSSGTVYGEKNNYAHKPEANVEAYDNYTLLKTISESEILNYKGGVVARLSNVYGQEMSNFNVISSIFKQLNFNTPIILQNQESIRDFIWIEDVVEGIIKIAILKHFNKECDKIYNISSGVGTSILSLTKLILELANQKNRLIKSQEPNKELISCLIMDNKKSIDELNWFPKTNLYNGINLLLKKD